MSSILGIIGWLIVCSVLNNTVFGKLYFQFEGFIIKPELVIETPKKLENNIKAKIKNTKQIQIINNLASR